jgi:hypothetical protein
MLRSMRLVCAAATALLALGVAGASGAGNHAAFTDLAGDNQGGAASDIISVDVTSQANGDVVFRITVVDPGARLAPGNTLDIFVDSDNDPSRWDTIMEAQGTTSGPSAVLCNYSSTGSSCERQRNGWFADQPAGGNAHVLTFRVSTSWSVIHFIVGSFGTADPVVDQAPNAGSVTYDLGDDTDRDGVAGSSDTCPNYKGGPFDRNHDGCPPLFDKPRAKFQPELSVGRSVTYRSIKVINASGASVVARFPGFTTYRRGSGLHPGVRGRHLRVGSLVTIVYSSPNYFGSYRRFKIRRGGDVDPAGSGCTLPGSTKFMSKCPKLPPE